MIPLLVISSHQEKQQTFLKELIRINRISKYDVFSLTPEKSSLGIDDIRTIFDILRVKISGKRIISIYSFETATLEAQSALLKALEEKTEDNIFVLFASQTDNILSTIVSRSRVMDLDKKMGKLDEKKFVILESFFSLLGSTDNCSYLSLDKFGLKTKEEVLVFIDDLIFFLRSYLLSQVKPNGITLVLKKAFQTKKNIRQLNCSYQMALDVLLIFINKTFTMK